MINTLPRSFEYVPDDVTITCNDPLPTDSPTPGTSCTNQTLSSPTDSVSPGDCAFRYTITRTWNLIDDCANSGEATQTITVTADDPPTISGGEDRNVSCDSIPSPTLITATPSCGGDVSVSFTEERRDVICPFSFTLIWTYTATDDCGNSAVHTQRINVVLDTPPVLVSIPNDTIVECDSIPVPPDVSANSICGTAMVTFTETRTDGGCNHFYTLRREWTSIDECGNAVSGSQTIQVVQTTPPVLMNIPSDETYECDNVTSKETAVVNASTNCGSASIVTISDTRIDGACANSYTIIREWTAQDECDNEATESQTITVVQTTPPIFDENLDNITVQCYNIPELPEISASSHCGNVTVSTVISRINGTCLFDYTEVRVFIAEDSCGNRAETSQAIKVVHTSMPNFTSVPAPVLDVSCGVTIPDETVSATSNCGFATVVLHEGTHSDTCPRSFYRQWRATDQCGNMNIIGQSVRGKYLTPISKRLMLSRSIVAEINLKVY